jgi:S1-C subfamily serine protease/pSer/pThr/pTyr-binding forkhead associated (FHA) protein
MEPGTLDPAKREAAMRLTFTDGDLTGRDVEIDADGYSIGRGEESDLRIPADDKRSSRHHAEITRRNGAWFIRDLNSSNGVWIDGHRIVEEAQLRDGQSVRIGAQHFDVAIPPADGGATVIGSLIGDDARAPSESAPAEVERAELEPEAVAPRSEPEPEAVAPESTPQAPEPEVAAPEPEPEAPAPGLSSPASEPAPPAPEPKAVAAEPPAPEPATPAPEPEPVAHEPSKPAKAEKAGAAGGALRSLTRVRSGTRRGYTTLLRRTDEKLRRLTIVAGVGVIIAVAVAVAAIAGAFSGESAQGLDVPALVRKAQPSVMLVDMKVDPSFDLENNRIAHGSGWVMNAKTGEIVTNAHVAAGGQSVKVALYKGRQRTARLVAMNYCQDVALLNTSDRSGLKTIPTVAQSQLSEGDSVVALGFPGTDSAKDPLVTTTGVISVVKTDQGAGYPDTVQTDAAINHGNSGGPLLNADGKVVGMNTLGKPDAQNQNFAISTNHIDQLLPELRRGVSTGWLGYLIDDLDPETADQPVITGSDGSKYYGPAVIGPAEGTQPARGLVGLSGDKKQFIYAIDGVPFGPGEKDLPTGDVQTAVCLVADKKKTGDTSKLSIVQDDGQTYQRFDVTVKYQ